MTTAAAIIIGDEILSAKVRDVNAPLLIDFFAEIGVDLKRTVVIGDDLEGIAAEVASCSENYDVVITSGGVGPTHDDCTVRGVADAFGVDVVRHPDIEEMIRAFWGERFTESALRMAEMPEGSRLFYGDDGLLPLVVFKNVYLFPGVPRLFAAKLPSLRGEITGTPKVVYGVYLNADESRVAPLLSQVAEECADVKIGSYPRFGEKVDHRLWISIEAVDADCVAAATDRLLDLLKDEEVVRVERS
ncbi:MAG: competence/damage-inducible protein A [Acidobacteria bacterium]|nr:competence/damage-inducible protein A [Acidobacteriota bacterium]